MGHVPIKYIEKGLSYVASGLWYGYAAASRLMQRESFTPRWSDKPLLKSWQKTKPVLGFPRATDSLCPTCVREARQEILDGRKDVSVLLTEKVGEIKAQIVERDGRILMIKDCPIHGHFEDVMSTDPAMFRHLEAMFPGRDITAHNDGDLHNHGSSTIKYGRGAVLTVDLTNRCNMMCEPCFMDANQVGFVHELSWDEIKTVLDNAISIKPRRQMSVQFSGGEPVDRARRLQPAGAGGDAGSEPPYHPRPPRAGRPVPQARRAVGDAVRQRKPLRLHAGARRADAPVGVAGVARDSPRPLAPGVAAGQRRPRADAPGPGRAPVPACPESPGSAAGL